jgi:hypothetical protein
MVTASVKRPLNAPESTPPPGHRQRPATPKSPTNDKAIAVGHVKQRSCSHRFAIRLASLRGRSKTGSAAQALNLANLPYIAPSRDIACTKQGQS